MYLSSLFLIVVLLCARSVSTSGLFQFRLIDYKVQKDESDAINYIKVCLNDEINCDLIGFDSHGFRNRSLIGIPFGFRWTKSFKLIIIVERRTKSGRIVDKQTDYETNVIPASSSSSSSSSASSSSLPHHYPVTKNVSSRLSYEYSVFCDVHYFGDDCAKLCKDADDNRLGHYRCSDKGDKQCLPGWNGDSCQMPICREGCAGGMCSVPGGCECRYGYKGKNCDECKVYPGCVHGYCIKPWDCLCYTSWGGRLCEQDLDLCRTRKPCLNGGLCHPVKPDHYLCSCPEEYAGQNCQIVVNPCIHRPCRNGGTCSKVTNSSYTCECPLGFTGHQCEVNINECESNPCEHGGKCVDRVASFECVCRDGFTGDRCEHDLNECESNACRPSSTDRCINTLGSFQCVCKRGFTGKHCQVNEDNCASSPCRNNGQCIDAVDSYQCRCPQGFHGVNCELINANQCQLSKYWQVNQSSCLSNWCTCSESSNRPVCKCVTTLQQSTASSSVESSASLLIVFNESTAMNATLICASLESLLSLIDSSIANQLTTCKSSSNNSIVIQTQLSDAIVISLITNLSAFKSIQKIVKQQTINHSIYSITILMFLIFVLLIIIALIVYCKLIRTNQHHSHHSSSCSSSSSPPPHQVIHNNLKISNEIKAQHQLINVHKKLNEEISL